MCTLSPSAYPNSLLTLSFCSVVTNVSCFNFYNFYDSFFGKSFGAGKGTVEMGAGG